MKTRTKFLSLVFGTTIATSAIIAPSIALSSCSNGSDSSNGTGNNNQGGNGSNKPATPLPQADTSNITTFVGAIQFTNNYLKQNYKLENFRDDLKKNINKLCAELIEFAANGNQFNCVFNMFPSSSNGVIDPTPSHKIELFNIKVDYALFWDETNNKLTPYLITTFDLIPAPDDSFFNTLQELEAKHPNYKTGTWGIWNDLDENKTIIRKKYFYGSRAKLIKNKIFTMMNAPITFPFDIQGIFSFVNIPKAEIQDHLYQPVPPQTQPQP